MASGKTEILRALSRVLSYKRCDPLPEGASRDRSRPGKERVRTRRAARKASPDVTTFSTVATKRRHKRNPDLLLGAVRKEARKAGYAPVGGARVKEYGRTDGATVFVAEVPVRVYGARRATKGAAA